MTRLQQIENEIQNLSPEEFAVFRAWFQEYEADALDRQLEHDVLSGKFDALRDEALAEHEAGRTHEI